MPKQLMYQFSLKSGITIFIKVNRHRTEHIYAKATNVSIFLKSWNRCSSKSTDIERNTSMPKQQMYQFFLKAGITIFIKVNRHRTEHIYAKATNVSIFLKSWNRYSSKSTDIERNTSMPKQQMYQFSLKAGITIFINVNRHITEHIYALATNVSIFLKRWNNDIHQSKQT